MTMTDGRTRKISRENKKRHGFGGFQIEILFPGAALGSTRDSGIGTIGRIDDAQVQPGTLVKMHPHRDDEILTYLRSGRVLHRDTVGDAEEISATRLMLMNAGVEFQHEELVQHDSEVLRGLQIFLRPSQGGLAPKVQFHDFGETISHGAWRRVLGPEETAPLVVRSRTWIDDGRFSPGPVELPAPPQHGVTRLLYVFAGEASVNDVLLQTGEAALLSGDFAEMVVSEISDLVLLSTDTESASFDQGMFSGNMFTATRS